MAKKTIEEESWNRYPDARVRMREGGLDTLLEGLDDEGYCFTSKPRVHLLDDGIYIEIPTNSGKHGSMVSLPIEIFIPVVIPEKPKKKAKKKTVAVVAEAVDSVAEPIEVVPVEPVDN